MDLGIYDLTEILSAVRQSSYDIDEAVYDALVNRLEELKELEEMDFDDCAGGACKL